MDGGMLLIIFAIFLGLLALGVPIVASLLIASLSAWFMIPGFTANPGFIFRNMVTVLDSMPLLAIPLFVFAGNIMANGGLSNKLFDLFAYSLGNKTGGMPAAVIITTFFYGSFIGSSPSTVAAVGVMTIPLLVSLGYQKTFAVALITVASSFSIILPPSTPLILYGVTVGASVGDLFIAGILPAVVTAVVMIIYVILYFRIKGGEDKEKLQENYKRLHDKGFFKVFKESIFALLSPVIILGGIYGGIVTPTEAANIAVIYSLFICVFVYRTLKAKDVLNIMISTVRTLATILVIISAATVFGRALMLMQAPQQVSRALMDVTGGSDVVLVLLILLFLIVFGLFMEPAAVILIASPIFFPIVTAIGMNSIHFGIVVIFTSAIGFITPPVGMSLFVATSISGLPLLKIARHTVPFLLLLAFVMLFVTFIPEISLTLIPAR
jgi:C4-dicarboxylate transporter DctM subunit